MRGPLGSDIRDLFDRLFHQITILIKWSESEGARIHAPGSLLAVRAHMRLQPLVVGLLAACSSTRGQDQGVAPNTGPPALAPGPHDVVLNGVRFFYSVGGTAADNPPVVFLHGGPGQGSEHFEALGRRFLERELRVVYFDQRGSGLSERPVNRDYAIATMVDDIEALRRAFGTPKIVVMGHSFGAVLALEYAAKYPAATSHVIVVAGLWDTEVQCPLRLARFAQLRPKVYARVRNDTLDPDGTRRSDCDIELRARNGLGDDRRLIDLETIFVDSTLAGRLDSVNSARNVVYGSEVNEAVMAAGMTRYRFTRFHAVTMPALVVAGKHDGAAIPAGLRPLAEELPHAQYMEFENSGHFVYLDEPDRFARVVTTFIKSRR
jgi:proline iminopeptidase